MTETTENDPNIGRTLERADGTPGTIVKRAEVGAAYIVSWQDGRRSRVAFTAIEAADKARAAAKDGTRTGNLKLDAVIGHASLQAIRQGLDPADVVAQTMVARNLPGIRRLDPADTTMTDADRQRIVARLAKEPPRIDQSTRDAVARRLGLAPAAEADSFKGAVDAHIIRLVRTR